jgi:tRNA dimethylallyltransferase
VAAPGSDEALRAELLAFADAEGNEALHRRLAAVDEETAKRLPPADRVRIVRALEIFLLTGKTASAHRKEHAFTADRYPHRLWVIDPPRAHLYARIDARTKAMFLGGLVDEVRRLVEQGYREAPAMGSVGYVQALACLEGRLSEHDAIVDAAQKTRHYAKRQWTWFKKEKGARAVAPPVDPRKLAEETRALEASVA